MREDVRIEAMRIEVSPEGRRVAVDVMVTPFIERPTIELTLLNGEGAKAGLLTIIETLDRTIQVVMHLRDSETFNPYTLQAVLYYTSVDEDLKRQKVDDLHLKFEVEPGAMKELSASDRDTPSPQNRN